MSDYYDRGGNPITSDQWGHLFQQGKGKDRGQVEEYARVGHDTIGHTVVSTVWLGIDHGWGGQVPIIFETMIFGGDYDQDQMRYTTEDGAAKGHELVVEDIRAGRPPWWREYSWYEEEE